MCSGSWSRNHDVAGLNMPAEDDLGVALTVLLAQLGEQRFLLECLVPVSQAGYQAWMTIPFVGQEGLQLLSWE